MICESLQEMDFVVIVFGCADLKIPKFAWYKREGNTATVGCEVQDAIWKLECEYSQWKGVIGNCSDNGRILCVFDAF